MALITLPSKVYFSKVEKFQLLRSGTTIRSKYTGKRQAIVHPFAVWVLEGTLIPLEGAEAGEWRAFLAQLEGQKNTFKLPVPGASYPTAPTGVVTGQFPVRSKTVDLYGTAGYTIAKGDYVTVNGELKLATAACTLQGGGVAAPLAFEPGLRAATTTGSPVELQNPYCTMAAVGDDAATWSLERPVRHGIKISAMEAF